MASNLKVIWYFYVTYQKTITVTFDFMEKEPVTNEICKANYSLIFKEYSSKEENKKGRLL